MFKIWIKTLKREKVLKSIIYKGEGNFELKSFRKYLSEMCEQLDIPTPVVLKSHVRNFEAFNITRFTPADFVEKVSFDKLVLEFCRDDHSEVKHIYKEYLPTD